MEKEPEPATKKLDDALDKVRKDIHSVPKKGRNDFHKYDYQRDEDILLAARTAMVKHKVLHIMHVEESKRESELTTIKTLNEFIHTSSGETREIRFQAQGQDKGDKGIYKAVTGARKALYRVLFQIPSEDDPEREEAPQKRDNGQPTKAQTKKETPKKPPELNTFNQADIHKIAAQHGLDPHTQMDQIIKHLSGEKK